MSSAVINRLDYQEPAFRVENINLVFNLDPVTTTVYNTMRIEPLTDSDHDLVLNGSELELASVFENGSPLSTERYTITPEALHHRGIRQKTTITIYNKFHPQAQHTALGHLYVQRELHVPVRIGRLPPDHLFPGSPGHADPIPC